MSTVGDLRALLGFSGFRRLIAVRISSQLADGIYQVALASYVVFSPESAATPADIASAMAVLLLPYSLLGPFAGVLLDRWRRRQVLLHGNLLRAVLACCTAVLVLGHAPSWLFYLSALSVTAVNRFVLAGLSASLPHVVDEERLMTANSLSPTAGTLAATAGGGLAFLVQLVVPVPAVQAEALVVVVSAFCYLAAALTSLRLRHDALGPADRVRERLPQALAGTVRGLAGGVRHLADRRRALHALTLMTLMRFCHGALTVMVLMLCRYYWSADDAGALPLPGGEPGADTGIRLLAVAVGASGAGFFAAAVLTPPATARLGRFGWLAFCPAAAAVLVPVLALPFQPLPMFAAAFALGTVTQGTKITTDTTVQSSVDDAFRGRVFALYDMLFNVAFVGAAGVTALMLPADGHAPSLVLTVTTLYVLTAAAALRARRSDGRG